MIEEDNWETFFLSGIEQLQVHGPNLTPAQRKSAIKGLLEETLQMIVAEEKLDKMLEKSS